MWLLGSAEALIVAAGLGNSPWVTFAQGIAHQAGITVGRATIGVSLAVLMLWFPLRQRPGLGTVVNALLVGVAIDATLRFLPTDLSPAGQVAELAGGLLLMALSTGAYLACNMGPGPRDGLMTGVHRITGVSVWLVRGTLELSALACGWLLGGNVGVGTLAFALTMGPGVAWALRVHGVTRPHDL